MQQDDREPNAAADVPGEPNATRDADEPSTARAPETEEEFENAPSPNRMAELERDEPRHEAQDETPSQPDGSAAESPAGPPPQEAEAYPASAAPQSEPSIAAAHSVPATQVGESTQCPRCGTENRPGVAFCRNCGQRLVAAGVASTLERPGAPQDRKRQRYPRGGEEAD